MAGGVIVGSVGVTVFPDASGFWSRFKADTQAGAQAASDDLARALASRIPGRLADAIRQGLGNPATTRAQGQRTGSAFADAFATTVKAKLDAAAKALGPRLKVTADTTPAQLEMEALRREVRSTEANIRIGRIDDKAAVAQIESIRVRMEALTRNAADIRVKVNGTAALAELAALNSAIKTVDNTAKDASGASGGMGLLARSALLLSPALVPIGAAAVPAIAALTAGAGVAALAVLGLKNNLDAAASNEVRGALGALKTDLTDLETVAARGVAPGLVKGFDSLHQTAPQLTGDVNALSHMLGNVFANSVQGATGTLQAFMPLILRVGAGVESLSAKFAGAGQSQGLQQFLDYVSTEGPQVVQMLSALGTSLGHIVQAAAPFGSVIVTGLTLFSDAVNHIPMPVLTALVGVLEAYLTYRTVSSVFTSLGTAIESFGTRAAATASQTALSATASSALGASLGPVGIAAAGVTAVLGAGLFMWQRHQAAVQAAKQAVQGYTQALQQDNGIISENTTLQAAKNLQDTNAFSLAAKIGISQQTITQAAIGNAEAQKTVTAAIDAANKKYSDSIVVSGQYADSTNKAAQSQADAGNKLRDILNQQTTALASAQTGQDNLNAATGKTAAEFVAQATVLGSLGQAQSYATVIINGTSLAMDNQQNAADVLHNALQNLSGNSLDAAQAQLSFESSLQQATAALGQNAGSLDITTQAGLADQQAILQMIAAANAHAEAVFKQTGSIDAANAALSQDEAAMLATAGAAGDNSAAVQALINKYAAVPADVSTVVTANTSQAQQAIDAVLGRLQQVEIMSAAGAPRPDLFLGASANGNIYAAKYASGGFENHVAQIAQPTYRLWAEPETGGEAYIPMAMSKRARSTAILNTVADDFGYQLTPQRQTFSQAAVDSPDLAAELRALRAEVGAGLAQVAAVTAGSARQMGSTVVRAVGAGGTRRNPQ